MIVSTIRQFGLRLRADPEEIPFQYSANVQMKFEKDENYNDYTVVGYYIPPGESEAKLLSINDDGTFTLGPDCFKQRGTLSFSFNLINSQEEVHLGSIDFEIRYAFGDSDTILPESEEVWISVVTKVAKDAIKDDVAVVQQKAKEALQSASLANDKANEAQEYANNANQSANSASLSASSALTAKNDAIAASNSAIQAKQDAEQSANNAKNSANTALENANKSTEAIETVTQIKTEIENKANDFDTNYQEKLKSFNDNATSKQNAFDNSVQTANTNFDNKVTQANSDLDAKVQEATKQAQKAKEEADRATQATDGKLDKNLGVENAGKSLVVGENGEVVCGESGINDDEVNKIIDKVIDEKLYTQEEVDYLLNDKMDKPYYDIAITDDTTIENTLAGNFKMDSIEGSIYQAEESGIVPTPERPIPIRSKKITVNDEVVELRSLKESVNIWDNTNIASYDGEGIQFQGWSNTVVKLENSFINLKTNTKYAIKMDVEMVEAIVDDTLTQFSLNKRLLLYRPSSNEFGLPSVSIPLGLYDSIMSNGEVQSISATFTSPEDLRGVVIAGYTERWLDSANKQYCAIVKFKNIMLVEGDSAPSSYVAPTVRDYKIVDHTNKTAKIVRNVGLYKDDKTGNGWTAYNNQTFQNSYFKNIKDMKRSNRILSYSNSFEVVNENTGVGNANSMWIGVTNSNVFVIRTDFKTIEEWKTWLTNNDLYFLYPLAMPIEQAIEYVETDVSEAGHSWQDTTSPSSTIKSEIYEVDEINIKLVGKNLYNGLYEEGSIDNVSGADTASSTRKRTFFINVKPLTTYTISNDGTFDIYITEYDKDKLKTGNMIQAIVANVGNAYKTFTTSENTNYIKFRNNDNQNFNNIQLEKRDTVTSYQPYQETSIQHTLSKPLRATKDGSVRDVIDVVNNNVKYRMKKYIVTGNETFLGDYEASSGYYSRYFNLDDGYGNDATQILSNYLTYVKYVWSLPQIGCSQNANRQIHLRFENKTLGITDDTPLEDKQNAYANYLKSLYSTDEPLYVIYGINEVTEPLEDELVEKLKTLKTFSPVTHVFVEGIAKPKLNAKYPKDIAAAQAQLEAKVVILQEAVIKNV